MRRSPRALRHHPGVARRHVGGDRGRRLFAERELALHRRGLRGLSRASHRPRRPQHFALGVRRPAAGVAGAGSGRARGLEPGRPPRDHPARPGRDVPAEEDAVHAGGTQDARRQRAAAWLRGALPAGRPAQTFGDNRDDYARLLLARDRQAFYRAYPLDVTPTTDDRPFFFHTTKLRNHAFVGPLARLARRPRRSRRQSRRLGDRRPDRAPGPARDLDDVDRRSSSSDRWR